MKVEPPKQETKVVKTQPPQTSATISLTLLNSLQEVRRRLEMAESDLTRHLHIPLGENGMHECSVHIQRLQVCNFIISSSNILMHFQRVGHKKLIK